LGQVGIEFFAPAADGIDVQTGDAGEKDVAAVPQLLGLEGREPASLLLIQAAEEQIHLGVELPLRVVLPSETSRALALMNVVVGHDTSSIHCAQGAKVSIRRSRK
jgi:hypothetical protein